MSVSTFGNLRIEAYLQLPAAYRSLSRPSSAPDAKAFTLCSYSLELPSEFLQLFSLNCLSFIEHLFWFSFRSKKVWSFLRFFFPSGWDLLISILGNCSSLPKLIGKTYSNLFCLLKCVLFYLFVSTHFTSLFGFQWTFSFPNLSIRWWAQVDSNHRPRAYQARALTTWAMSPFSFSMYLVSLAYSFYRLLSVGGDDGIRTHDPLLAGQVLSQLSYTPILGFYGHWKLNNSRAKH